MSVPCTWIEAGLSYIVILVPVLFTDIQTTLKNTWIGSTCCSARFCPNFSADCCLRRKNVSCGKELYSCSKGDSNLRVYIHLPVSKVFCLFSGPYELYNGKELL